MKTSIRWLFNKIATVIMAVLIMCGTPVVVLAESNTLNKETPTIDSLGEMEGTVLAENGSYSFTAPTTGSFLIRNMTGTMSIVNGYVVVQFANLSVSLPAFDYYKIVDGNNTVRFYQADVLDPMQTSSFVYIAVYIENGPTYSLHFQYMSENKEIMYNVTVPLAEDEFQYLTQNAITLCLGLDAVSQRLKASGRAYTHGAFEVAEADTNQVSTYSLNTISVNTYDEYTNADGIIKSYVESYFGDCWLEDGRTVTDDPIVNIIPKELCFIPGEHLYVGKEYGFFIRVMTDAYIISDYSADIMVFDITHVVPSFPSNVTGSAKIEPLFQFTYRATEGRETTIDPSLSCAVFPNAMYDYAEYFLRDVGFKFTLDNPAALNPGDRGYDPYDDDGAFIIQTRVNASGVGLKKKNGSFLADTAMFTFGYVPVVGEISSIYSYAHDVYNGFGNGNYFYTRQATVNNNEAYIDTYETNSTDQINARGNLIKSKSVALISNDTSPRLINVGGGYVEAKYVVARKTGSNNNKIRVTTSISVNVVEDNTSLILGIPSGEVVEYGRVTGTYETSNYRRLDDISLNGSAAITIAASLQRRIIKITPKVSGSYKLYTTSNYGDPNFCITNATKGTSTVAATDDINGVSDRNAVLTIDLYAGDIYYLEAFNYSGSYGYTLRMGYNPTSTQTITAGVPYSVSTASDTYQMLKFTPAVSGDYEFFTNKTSGDPQMFLFSASGSLIDSDDDSGANLDAWFECNLIAGSTYYIAVQGYNGNAAEFTVTASPLS